MVFEHFCVFYSFLCKTTSFLSFYRIFAFIFVQRTNFLSARGFYKNYTYGLAGNRTGFTLEKGGETVHNISYSYDNLNRLSTVSENGAAKKSYKISRSRHRFDDSSFFYLSLFPSENAVPTASPRTTYLWFAAS